MEKLAALAVVTQQVVPRFTQETAADLQRTHLDLERSCMASEDRYAQLQRYHDRQLLDMQTGFFAGMTDLQNDLEETTEELDECKKIFDYLCRTWP